MDRFKYKRSLGQNFLKDESICKKIVDSALIDNNTLVIEIGAGDGAISKYIAFKCKYFIMFEIDERLRDNLLNKFGNYNNCNVIIDDFLKIDIKSLLSKYDYDKLYVVSNVPYYITTPIISKFIDEEIFADKMVIMMQKEVADRFCARAGSRDYGAFTVILNCYYDIVRLFDVNRNCFNPVPGVDSSVILMEYKGVDNSFYGGEFNRFVRDCFNQKRKTLKNNLKDYDMDVVFSVLSSYGYDDLVRAEDLELDVFFDLYRELYKSDVK